MASPLSDRESAGIHGGDQLPTQSEDDKDEAQTQKSTVAQHDDSSASDLDGGDDEDLESDIDSESDIDPDMLCYGKRKRSMYSSSDSELDSESDSDLNSSEEVGALGHNPGFSAPMWKNCVHGSTQRNFSFCPPRKGINVDLIPPNSLPLKCFHALLTEDLIKMLMDMINERANKKLAEDKNKGKESEMSNSSNEMNISDTESDFEFLDSFTEGAAAMFWAEVDADEKDSDEDEGEEHLEWRDMTMGEMYKFFLVLVYTGIMTLPRMKDFWGYDIFYDGRGFRKIFSRQRFFQIYDIVLELCDFSKPTPMVDFVELLVKNFSAAFYPGEHLTVNEFVSGAARRGWSHKGNDVGSCHRVKTLGLVDNKTSYVVNLCNYYGASHRGYKTKRMEYDEKSKLLDKLLLPCSVGHHLSFGKLYSHLPVLKHLGEKFFYTGCVDIKRDSSIPREVRNDFRKLKVGECKWLMDDKEENLMAMHRDRVMKMSSALISNHAETKTILCKKGKKTPAMFHDYNAMSKGNRKIQNTLELFGCYDRPVRCWNKKFFRWLFEIIQLNTLVLFTHSQDKLPKIRRPYRYLKRLLGMELCRTAVRLYVEQQGGPEMSRSDDDDDDCPGVKVKMARCFCGCCKYIFERKSDEEEEMRSWRMHIEHSTWINFYSELGLDKECDSCEEEGDEDEGGNESKVENEDENGEKKDQDEEERNLKS